MLEVTWTSETMYQWILYWIKPLFNVIKVILIVTTSTRISFEYLRWCLKWSPATYVHRLDRKSRVVVLVSHTKAHNLGLLYQKIEKFDGQTPFDAWLYQLVFILVT